MKLRAYLKAAHFGPTMIVTTIAFLLAVKLGWVGLAFLIAFTVFLGQLLVGWSNDLYDFPDDLKHNRINKPLVAGTISVQQLRRATFILIPFTVIANILGPLGIKGGSVYLLGVGCGIAYNFYFKFSTLSPLPYAIACAALPASIFYAINRTPPIWLLAVGSMLGVAFHFANVLKDLPQDVASQIKGLPQRVGKGVSISIALVLLVLSAALFINSPTNKAFASIGFESPGSFVVGGDRPATVFIPTGYVEDRQSPLLIDLHGYTGDSMRQSRFSTLQAAAEMRTVVYVAPDGLKDSQGNQFWNASKACCNFESNQVDDATYIKSLINEISNQLSIDAKRIYIFGHSNGHFMAYKFACTYPQSVAAIAGLAGAMDVDPALCSAKTAVNVLHIHGTNDETVLFDGGSFFENSYASAIQSVHQWAVIDKCKQNSSAGTPFDLIGDLSGSETTPITYRCPANSVEIWTIQGGTHSPKMTHEFGLKVIDWFLAHPKK